MISSSIRTLPFLRRIPSTVTSAAQPADKFSSPCPRQFEGRTCLHQSRDAVVEELRDPDRPVRVDAMEGIDAFVLCHQREWSAEELWETDGTGSRNVSYASLRRARQNILLNRFPPPRGASRPTCSLTPSHACSILFSSTLVRCSNPPTARWTFSCSRPCEWSLRRSAAAACWTRWCCAGEREEK